MKPPRYVVGDLVYVSDLQAPDQLGVVLECRYRTPAYRVWIPASAGQPWWYAEGKLSPVKPTP